jgi:UDP-N-acetylglucosamine transferase subunit ALG13
MLEALREVEDEIVVQYGHNPAPVGFARAEAFVAFDEVLALIGRADAVVTHAGVGSILCARGAGHTPVVIPRLKRFGEHVDDHQAQLTRALEERGEVIALWDATGLRDAVARALPRQAERSLEETPLHAAVREALQT